MFKLSIKSLWIGGFAMVAALGVAIKLAFALAVFVPQDAPVGYVAQDEVTNFNLKSGNEVLFRGQYEREFWSGTLLAYPISNTGALGDKSVFWSGDAAALIETQNFDTGRLIATLKDDGTKIAFRWNSLSAIQQGYLTSSTILDFLRGDRSNEIPNAGGTLRQRATAFGDVIHSRPLFVDDLVNPTVFVGSNDGMLHAVNAAGSASGGGQERWAYVPSMLLPKMKRLSADPYVHDYYVDGQINVASILSGSKRVLVGGLGAGGKGLYALDITGSAGLTATDEATLANKAMWEITPTKVSYASPTTTNAYVNLGYTYGTVTMAKVAGGVDAVIVGNGFNDGLGSYTGCTHATPTYTNCGGNYAAYLYVINANTGQLISAIKAGGDGTAASPNGLSTAAAVDSDGNGLIDRVYAGDLNGTMWKFDLATGTATALLTTSPAQAITSTPGVALHPNGGYMVNFVTGKMLVTADTTDASVFYAYGVWDGAPVANTALLTQTLSARNYMLADGLTVIPVRRVTSNQPNYSAGAGNHMGWKVALPAGEKVAGEGSFIENGRFYFMSHNPTISHTVPNTSSTIYGDNWQMELDYLTGGSKNEPFLDLSGNLKLDDADRIKYITGDTIPTGSAVGDPILTTDGIPVGKYLGIGLFSQPILVQLVTLNDTLYNQNPDIVVPASPVDRGVAGGHFDVEIYYGSTPAAQAQATITLSTTGQISGRPATLGAISVNGVVIAPALTTSDITNGFATSTNATVIKGKVGAGFTAARSGSTVVIKAPAGASYNGVPLTIVDGTSQAAVPSWTNLKLGFTTTVFTGGADVKPGDTCANGTIRCAFKQHDHEYDDAYDKTGVNFLDPGNPNYNISKAIASTATPFKVLVANQYLSPAVKLNIGNPGYLFNVDAGYVALKDYQTSATLDVAALPTYTRANIGSFAFNMPVNAFTPKDWWGGANGLPADVRVGLIPNEPRCVYQSFDKTYDGNMYQPVIPAGSVTADGNGTNGYSSATTALTATGVRHNGGLTFQVIKDSTPNSAIELNVAGRPEYGWRVKSQFYATYVLVEYTTFWHTKHLNICYGEPNFTKLPPPDNRPCGSVDTQFVRQCGLPPPPPGGTDPLIGNLGGGGGTVVSVTTTSNPAGNVTTTVIVFSNTLTARIVRTANGDGSVTIVTTDTAGTTTTQVIANSAGAVKSGGDERGLQAKTGRISWRELVAP